MQSVPRNEEKEGNTNRGRRTEGRLNRAQGLCSARRGPIYPLRVAGRGVFRGPKSRVRKLKWYILLKRLGNSSGTSCQNAKKTQMVHPVKTLRKLKWYILLKRLGNSSGTSCQNAKETQVVRPVKTLGKLKWYILSKRQENSSGTSC